MPPDLWSYVAACFDTDNGSLPGVEITPLSPSGLAAIFALLHERSRLQGDTSFWDYDDEADRPVAAATDLAVRIALGRASSTHILLKEATVGETILPDRGVFLFPDSVELNYQMGPAWGTAEVAGFFQLLKECCDLEPSAMVVPAADSPPYSERFRATWEAYRGD